MTNMIMSICDPLSNLPMRSLTVVTSFIEVARYNAMLLCSRDFISFKIIKDMFTNTFGFSQWYQKLPIVYQYRSRFYQWYHW